MKRTTVAIVAALLVLTACEGARLKTLRVTYTALSSAQAGYVVWDREAQRRIIARATSYEEGVKQIAEYREGQAKIVAAFTLAYSALAAVALDFKPGSLGEAVAAARDLYTAIRAFQEKWK